MTEILIVEDQPRIRTLLSANLSVRGYRTIEVERAEAALEILEDSMPDLLLLDISLPGMNGWDLLDRLSSEDNYEDLPVIIITGTIVERDDHAPYGNVQLVITKPLQVSYLLESVQKVLAN